MPKSDPILKDENIHAYSVDLDQTAAPKEMCLGLLLYSKKHTTQDANTFFSRYQTVPYLSYS